MQTSGDRPLFNSLPGYRRGGPSLVVGCAVPIIARWQVTGTNSTEHLADTQPLGYLLHISRVSVTT